MGLCRLWAEDLPLTLHSRLLSVDLAPGWVGGELPCLLLSFPLHKSHLSNADFISDRVLWELSGIYPLGLVCTRPRAGLLVCLV